LEAEKKRREYESLFASNVVVSRRADRQRPSVAEPVNPGGLTRPTERDPLAPPTLEEVADAVIRATARHAPNSASPPLVSSSAQSGDALSKPAKPQPLTNGRATPESTGPISASGPLDRILEGTFIDTVLTNRLDGSSAAPVNCLVTNPVYSHSG